MFSWEEVVKLHSDAAEEFAQAAEQIPPDKWAESTPDRWGAAHVTEHLSRAYEILLKELNGQDQMKVRTKPVRRQLLRWFLVPRLLAGAAFPRARAPRETRPAEIRTPNQKSAVETFRSLALQFAQEILDCHEANPGKKLTHAYFGSSDLKKALLLAARHIQHHTKHLK